MLLVFSCISSSYDALEKFREHWRSLSYSYTPSHALQTSGMHHDSMMSARA